MRRVCALAVAVAAAVARDARGQSESAAHWLAPVSGSWFDAAKWSSNPKAPSGTVHAVIDAVGAAYVVSGAAYPIDRVTLDSPNATLLLTGGLFAPGQLDLRAGVLRLAGGTLQDARITGAPGATVQLPGSSTASAYVARLTVASELTFGGGSATVFDGITLDNGTLRVGTTTGGAQGGDPTLVLYRDCTIGGTGTVELLGTSSAPHVMRTGGWTGENTTTTFGPGVTLRPGAGAARAVITLGSSYGKLYNDGTILVDRAGFEFEVAGGGGASDRRFVNRGTIRATAGTLTLSGLSNAGAISVDGATLNLTGSLDLPAGGSLTLNNAATTIWATVSTESLGRITRTGGSLSVLGRVDNTGQTFDPARYGVTALGGGVFGGTFAPADPDVLARDYYLQDVTLGSDLRVKGTSLNARGVLTLDRATVTVDGGTLLLDGNGYGGQVRGQGQVVLTGSGPRIAVQTWSVIGAEVDVRFESSGTISPSGALTGGRFTNQGNITVAPGRTLTVSALDWLNQGTITLDGANLNVYGLSNVANLGTVHRTGGRVVWAPTVSAPGATLDFNAGPAGPMEMGASNLARVTVEAQGRALNVYPAYEYARLTDVTLAADLVLLDNTRYEVSGNLTLGGSVRFGGTNSLTFSGTAAQTLGGNGAVVFDGGSIGRLFVQQPLVVGAGVSLRTGAGDGQVATGSGAGITNRGTISADGPGRVITLETRLVNEGTIEAVNGGTVGLLAPFTNNGTVRLDGGKLRLGGAANHQTISRFSATNSTLSLVGGGTFDNAGQALVVREVGRGLTLELGNGGKISGGTIDSPDGTPLRVTTDGRPAFSSGDSGVLTDVTVNAPLVLEPFSRLAVVGGRLNGAVRVDGASITLGGSLSGPVALAARNNSTVTLGVVPAAAGLLIEDSTLVLATNATTAALEAVPTVNAKVVVGASGVLDNGGRSLVVDAPGKAWSMSGNGRIVGGRIEAGRAATVFDAAGTLDNVDLAVSVKNGSGMFGPPLTIANTVTQSDDRGAGVAFTNRTNLVVGKNATLSLAGPLVGVPEPGYFPRPTGQTTVSNGASLVLPEIRQDRVTVYGSVKLLPAASGAGAPVSRVVDFFFQQSGPTILGTVDIGEVPLVWDLGTTFITAPLKSGYAGGTWAGTGLTSSAAAADPSTGIGYISAAALFGIGNGQTANVLGETVGPAAMLVRQTLLGDANLDLVVDFADLVIVAQNYNATDGRRPWYQGDFTYDGNVDFNDLVRLAQNYNRAPVGGAIAGAPAGFDAELARAFASVPEPGGGWVAVVAAWGWVGRGRRARRGSR